MVICCTEGHQKHLDMNLILHLIILFILCLFVSYFIFFVRLTECHRRTNLFKLQVKAWTCFDFDNKTLLLLTLQIFKSLHGKGCESKPYYNWWLIWMLSIRTHCKYLHTDWITYRPIIYFYPNTCYLCGSKWLSKIPLQTESTLQLTHYDIFSQPWSQCDINLST